MNLLNFMRKIFKVAGGVTANNSIIINNISSVRGITMKIAKSVLLMAVMLASGTAVAYSPEELEKECHKPKFTDFTLTEYKAPQLIETPAEAEFSFKVQAFTNPESIRLTIKKQPLAFTVESNSSFHKVKAKIPAEFTGKFARLDVRAKVIDGECHEETGWLLKIADKAPAAESTTTEAAPTEAAPAIPDKTETAPASTTTEAKPDEAATTNVAPPTTEVVPTR
jgi:hypothetical protein